MKPFRGATKIAYNDIEVLKLLKIFLIYNRKNYEDLKKLGF